MTPKRSRALAVGLLASLIIATVLGAALPFVATIRTANADLQHAFSRLARATAHARDRDPVRSALAELDARPLWSRLYGPGDGATALGTDISTALGRASAGAVTTSVPPQPLGPVTAVRSHVHLRVTAGRLADGLAGLRHAPKLLVIQSLTINGPATQRPDVNELLDIELEIAGFQLTASPP